MGGSAVLLKSNNKSVLVDYGVYMSGTPHFPLPCSPRELSAIVLTHSHLDHSGAIPLLYVSGNVRLFTTKMTLGLTELLISDELKLSGELLPFEENELTRMVRRSQPVNIGEQVKLNDNLLLNFTDAGHIPGSISALIETEGKRIFVTGDINTVETRLLEGAKIDVSSMDVIVIEGTYALQDHPKRKDTEKEFVDAIKETLEGDGGKVLIPAFAVARAQEILCVLEKYGVDYPITIDGMVRAASKIFLRNPSFVRDYSLLRRALEKALWVHGKRDKERAVSNPGIIIASAGMLEGGAAVGYLNALSQDPKNGIFLVSFQIPGTTGRNLIETGAYVSNNGEKRKAKSKVRFFDFSSHCGKSELWEILKRLNSSTKVYVVHGEEESCTSLAERINNELGIAAIAPNNGDCHTLQ
nr:MBL fold metallo-hydrolase [Candidatus Njordarchaeum guaymaensis]